MQSGQQVCNCIVFAWNMFDVNLYVKGCGNEPYVPDTSSQNWVLGFAGAYHLDYSHIITKNLYFFMAPKMAPRSEGQDYIEHLQMHNGECKARNC